MKRLFVTLIFLTATSALYAQGMSAGARVGATAFFENSGRGWRMPFAYQQGSLTPEVFLRYTAKKHWAFEASLNASRLHSEESVEAIDAPWHYAHAITNTNVYALGLSAQYELTCHHAKKASLRRFHYYIGLSVNPVLAHGVENIYPVETPDKSVMTVIHNDYQLWGGINHTFTYDLNKCVSLTALFDTRLNFGKAFFNSYGNDNPSASAGLRLGAAFRLSGLKK